MSESIKIITQLTSGNLSPSHMIRLVKDFSQELGWEPGEAIDPVPDLSSVISGHLIVEHGLEISAVITFLISPNSYDNLTPQQKNKSLELSYNNLVDWHLYVEENKVTYVYNRSQPTRDFSYQLSKDDTENLKSTMFDQITGRAPNPNFPTLDTELVNNISYWKRNLAAELEGSPDLADYASLFNSIIFTRAAEDHRKRTTGDETKILLEKLKQIGNGKLTIGNVIRTALRDLIKGTIPKYVFDNSKLKSFDDLSENLIFDILLSFYKSRSVPYSYDFAIMSKHALTRIYEKYVALLYFEENNQLAFFPILPSETYSKRFGSVYTPEFISRFFARYAQNNISQRDFRTMSVVDPACGSGIFLRTILEFQSSPGFDPLSSDEIRYQFTNVVGVDIDENAIQTSRLSIALLHLVLMSGELPKTLKLSTKDAISYFSAPTTNNHFDLLISNPPYIATDNQPEEIRKASKQYLGELGEGKIDAYLPFLKIAIETLKPGGFGMFVLPHSFLKSKSGRKIRGYITKNSWIRCVVDLSEIPVFKDQGSYVILLIFQKKPTHSEENNQPKANVVVCKDFVGHALSDYLKGLRVNKEFYEIFDLQQSAFKDKEWRLASPSERKIIRKLNHFESLGKYLNVFQGVVTGNDSVFIVDKQSIPKTEHVIWRPLLPDRDMLKYKVPKTTNKIVFYPKIDNHTFSSDEIADEYPITWKYLESQREKLTKRGKRNDSWWVPHRLRNSRELFRPKLVTPHLVLLPKFSLDKARGYVISRAPLLTTKDTSEEVELLKFFMGILNSDIGAWLISSHSDKYSKGYARLEVGTLKRIPVPNPAKISGNNLGKMIDLVNKQLQAKFDLNIDNEIELLTEEIYDLSHADLSEIGLLGGYAKDY
jgi:type I restriction-modification system DNA methylase subunit